MFGILLALMAIRVPIYLAMGIASLVYFLQTGTPLEMLAQRSALVLDSFPLVAIPLFMLAGRLMNVGGVTQRIYAFCHDLVGFIPGGLGHVNVYRELRASEAIRMTVEVGREVAGLTIIMAMGLVFGWILTVEQVPQAMAGLILQFADNKAVVLLAINLLVLFLGCFMEAPVLLLVLPPILVPPLATIGVDPVHFGIVLIIAAGIGMYTPPIGVALYAVQRFTNIDFGEVVAAMVPWLLPLVIALFIVTYVPWLALSVPRAFGF